MPLQPLHAQSETDIARHVEVGKQGIALENLVTKGKLNVT